MPTNTVVSEDVIYLRHRDGHMVEMTASFYDSERELQELLAHHEHLLAGEQVNPDTPRRWLLVDRELGIAWEEGGSDQLSLDHLFLDQDAIPTLVEVKRSSDTRIRREVVGQMLEYAANAVAYWPAERIRARFVARCEHNGLDPSQLVQDLIAEEGDPSAVDIFWQSVQTNLRAGRVRMIFVADEIPAQLRRMVEFLDAQMTDAEVLAIEVKQYVGGEFQALVPRVVGRSSLVRQQKSVGPRETRQWDETSFFEEVERRWGEPGARVARAVYEWSRKHTEYIWWGRGKQNGSFNPLVVVGDHRYQVFGVWTSGGIEVQFQYMKQAGSLDDSQRLELLRRINEVTGIAWPDWQITRRPSIPFSLLAKPGVMDRFLAVLEWTAGEIRKAHRSNYTDISA